MTVVETEAFREVCYRCRRARAVCLCPALTPITPAARIVFLQHPREARNAIGTVRLAHLQLEGSTIIEGVELAASAETMALFERERARSVVLYPAKNARPAEELRALVQAAIAETGAAAPSDMGKVMKVVMPKVAGRAPNDAISAAVKELLAK